jgi:hypothetical protein
MEKHRSLPVMRPLKPPEHPIALADPQPSLAVVIEREHPGNLRERPLGIRVALKLDLDDTVRLRLPQAGRRVTTAFSRKRQAEDTVELAGCAFRRPEPE